RALVGVSAVIVEDRLQERFAHCVLRNHDNRLDANPRLLYRKQCSAQLLTWDPADARWGQRGHELVDDAEDSDEEVPSAPEEEDPTDIKIFPVIEEECCRRVSGEIGATNRGLWQIFLDLNLREQARERDEANLVPIQKTTEKRKKGGKTPRQVETSSQEGDHERLASSTQPALTACERSLVDLLYNLDTEREKPDIVSDADLLAALIGKDNAIFRLRELRNRKVLAEATSTSSSTTRNGASSTSEEPAQQFSLVDCVRDGPVLGLQKDAPSLLEEWILKGSPFPLLLDLAMSQQVNHRDVFTVGDPEVHPLPAALVRKLQTASNPPMPIRHMPSTEAKMLSESGSRSAENESGFDDHHAGDPVLGGATQRPDRRYVGRRAQARAPKQPSVYHQQHQTGKSADEQVDVPNDNLSGSTSTPRLGIAYGRTAATSTSSSAIEEEHSESFSSTSTSSLGQADVSVSVRAAFTTAFYGRTREFLTQRKRIQRGGDLVLDPELIAEESVSGEGAVGVPRFTRNRDGSTSYKPGADVDILQSAAGDGADVEINTSKNNERGQHPEHELDDLTSRPSSPAAPKSLSQSKQKVATLIDVGGYDGADTVFEVLSGQYKRGFLADSSEKGVRHFWRSADRHQALPRVELFRKFRIKFGVVTKKWIQDSGLVPGRDMIGAPGYSQARDNSQRAWLLFDPENTARSQVHRIHLLDRAEPLTQLATLAADAVIMLRKDRVWWEGRVVVHGKDDSPVELPENDEEGNEPLFVMLKEIFDVGVDEEHQEQMELKLQMEPQPKANERTKDDQHQLLQLSPMKINVEKDHHEEQRFGASVCLFGKYERDGDVVTDFTKMHPFLSSLVFSLFNTDETIGEFRQRATHEANAIKHEQSQEVVDKVVRAGWLQRSLCSLDWAMEDWLWKNDQSQKENQSLQKKITQTRKDLRRQLQEITTPLRSVYPDDAPYEPIHNYFTQVIRVLDTATSSSPMQRTNSKVRNASGTTSQIDEKGDRDFPASFECHLRASTPAVDDQIVRGALRVLRRCERVKFSIWLQFNIAEFGVDMGGIFPLGQISPHAELLVAPAPGSGTASYGAHERQQAQAFPSFDLLLQPPAIVHHKLAEQSASAFIAQPDVEDEHDASTTSRPFVQFQNTSLTYFVEKYGANKAKWPAAAAAGNDPAAAPDAKKAWTSTGNLRRSFRFVNANSDVDGRDKEDDEEPQEDAISSQHQVAASEHLSRLERALDEWKADRAVFVRHPLLDLLY
ncbi:unnamed protein product, partial [Amoebophrya sp. A120]